VFVLVLKGVPFVEEKTLTLNLNPQFTEVIDNPFDVFLSKTMGLGATGEAQGFSGGALIL
jgi:hypothetical protein